MGFDSGILHMIDISSGNFGDVSLGLILHFNYFYQNIWLDYDQLYICKNYKVINNDVKQLFDAAIEFDINGKNKNLKNILEGNIYKPKSKLKNILILPFYNGYTLKYYLDNNYINNNGFELIINKIYKKLLLFHLEEYIYGDIKEDNIIIDKDGNVYFCDLDNILLQTKGLKLKYINSKYYDDDNLNEFSDIKALVKLHNNYKGKSNDENFCYKPLLNKSFIDIIKREELHIFEILNKIKLNKGILIVNDKINKIFENIFNGFYNNNYFDNVLIVENDYIKI